MNFISQIWRSGQKLFSNSTPYFVILPLTLQATPHYLTQQILLLQELTDQNNIFLLYPKC